MSDEELTHPLVGKIVRWSHGESVLVGPATHFDPDDNELFIVPDGLAHGHYWVPAGACREHIAPTDDEREALANLIPLGFTERDPVRNVYEAADRILAAGFRRGAPAEPPDQDQPDRSQ